MSMAGGCAFAVAQQIGKSLFLLIAVLPFAGILLGIGSSFSNPITIDAYGLSGVLHQGTFLYGLMELLTEAGEAIFGNLALIFALYFVVFHFFILKMDLKTPGREADGEAAHLVSKEEYRNATGVGVAGGKAALAADDDPKSAAILRGVGGSENLGDIDCCATRLRLTLNDTSMIDEVLLKSTGASGVVVKGNGIQVIYGPSVTIVKSNFEEYVAKVLSGQLAEPIGGPSGAVVTAGNSGAEGWLPGATYGAHMNGRMLLLNEVEDEAFASCALGDGVAIEPSEGKLYAPADGTIDTVKLGGQYYKGHVKDDQKVRRGDLLISFEIEGIRAAGYKVTTPRIVCNTDNYRAVRPLAGGEVKAGSDFTQVVGS